MRAPKYYSRPMLVAAAFLALFACVDRGDPTAPGTSDPSNDVTIAVQLPVSSLEVGHVVSASLKATNSAGKTIEADSVVWSSSDSTILAVSSTGKVTARKMGAAAVEAKWRKLAGRGSLAVTDTVPAKVVVSPSSVSAAVGSQIHLSAAVATTTGRALPGHVVKWTSTNTRYASVSSAGVVTGSSPGSARVIAQASQVADTAVVSVASASIANLSVSPGTATLASGQTVDLTAQATDAAGNPLTGRSVGWESSDDAIASVSTSGVVTAGKVGSATITATAEGVRASASIRVTAGSVQTVAITPGSIGLVAGAQEQLSASLEDNAGNTLSAPGVAWASANSSVATVSSNGLVTAVHVGSTSITAVSGNGIGHASVVVSAGAVKTISLTPESFSLVTGGTRQLSAKLTDAAGNTLADNAAWSSSNNTIATVSSSGLVTAKHSGSATITAAAGGTNGTAALSVEAGSVSSVAVSPGSSSLAAGDTQQLAAKLTDNSGSMVTGQTVTWSTSDASIVKVSSSGLATAAHVGRATITATAGGQTGSATFSVSAGPVNSVAVSPASGSVEDGKTLQLTVAFTDVAGNTVPGGTVSWTSSNASAATVGSSGLVTGVAPGSANITATAGGKSTSAAITVTAPVRTAPTLTRITISPATVTLAPNATAQFTTSATWSDGSTTSPTVAYSASGGSISSSGLYTAGSSSGSFRVVVTDVGKADTSTVSITGSTVSQGSSCRSPRNVGTVTELTAALSQANAGDCILLAPGTYTLQASLSISRGGTAASPVIVEGAGSSTIIDVNRHYMYLDASNVQLRKVRLTNFNSMGLWLRGVTGDVLDSVEIDHTLQEAFAFKSGSNHNVVKNSLIHDTGISNPQYGEGIYVGGVNGDGSPDRATDNQILSNHIGPNVRAEGVDIKEGADRTIVRGNYFDGTGEVFINYATTSVVAVVASYSLLDDNYIGPGNPHGVSYIQGKSPMVGNVATRNTIDLQQDRTGMPWSSVFTAASSILGFQLQTYTYASGITIKCDNVMLNGGRLTNNPLGCQP